MSRNLVRLCEVWCVLCMAVGATLFGQEGLTSQERQKRRDALVGMPPRQREILVKNFNEFRSLTPEQREYYRQLQGEIKRHHEHDKLAQVLKNYHDWLGQLSESQYLELQQIKDPEQKFLRVKEITDAIEAQRKEKEKYQEDMKKLAELASAARTAEASKPATGSTPATEPNPTPPVIPANMREWFMGQLQDRFQHSPQTFPEILKVVEVRMREIKAITPDEDSKLNSMKGWERSHYLIVEVLPLKQKRTDQIILNPGVREEIVKLLAPRALEMAPNRSFVENRKTIVQVVSFGLLTQLRDVMKDPATTDSQKGKIRGMLEERMSPEERNRINSMINPHAVVEALAKEYGEQILDAFISAGEIFPVNGPLKPGQKNVRERMNSERRPNAAPLPQKQIGF